MYIIISHSQGRAGPRKYGRGLEKSTETDQFCMVSLSSGSSDVFPGPYLSMMLGEVYLMGNTFLSKGIFYQSAITWSIRILRNRSSKVKVPGGMTSFQRCWERLLCLYNFKQPLACGHLTPITASMYTLTSQSCDKLPSAKVLMMTLRTPLDDSQ